MEDDILAPFTIPSDSEDDDIRPSSPTTLGPTSALSSPVHYSSHGGEEPQSGFFDPTSPPSTPTHEPEESRVHTVGSAAADQPQERTTIWGTSINVKDTLATISNFLREFPDPTATQEKLYPRLLTEMRERDTYNVNLNADYVNSVEPTLYEHLTAYPLELVPLFESALNELFGQMFPGSEESRQRLIQVRPFNLKKHRPMRDLDPDGDL